MALIDWPGLCNLCLKRWGKHNLVKQLRLGWGAKERQPPQWRQIVPIASSTASYLSKNPWRQILIGCPSGSLETLGGGSPNSWVLGSFVNCISILSSPGVLFAVLDCCPITEYINFSPCCLWKGVFVLHDESQEDNFLISQTSLDSPRAIWDCVPFPLWASALCKGQR